MTTRILVGCCLAVSIALSSFVAMLFLSPDTSFAQTAEEFARDLELAELRENVVRINALIQNNETLSDEEKASLLSMAKRIETQIVLEQASLSETPYFIQIHAFPGEKKAEAQFVSSDGVQYRLFEFSDLPDDVTDSEVQGLAFGKVVDILGFVEQSDADPTQSQIVPEMADLLVSGTQYVYGDYFPPIYYPEAVQLSEYYWMSDRDVAGSIEQVKIEANVVYSDEIVMTIEWGAEYDKDTGAIKLDSQGRPMDARTTTHVFTLPHDYGKTGDLNTDARKNADRLDRAEDLKLFAYKKFAELTGVKYHKVGRDKFQLSFMIHDLPDIAARSNNSLGKGGDRAFARQMKATDYLDLIGEYSVITSIDYYPNSSSSLIYPKGGHYSEFFNNRYTFIYPALGYGGKLFFTTDQNEVGILDVRMGVQCNDDLPPFCWETYEEVDFYLYVGAAAVAAGKDIGPTLGLGQGTPGYKQLIHGTPITIGSRNRVIDILKRIIGEDIELYFGVSAEAIAADINDFLRATHKNVYIHPTNSNAGRPRSMPDPYPGYTLPDGRSVSGQAACKNVYDEQAVGLLLEYFLDGVQTSVAPKDLVTIHTFVTERYVEVADGEEVVYEPEPPWEEICFTDEDAYHFSSLKVSPTEVKSGLPMEVDYKTVGPNYFDRFGTPDPLILEDLVDLEAALAD